MISRIEILGGHVRLKCIKIGKIIITTEHELANLNVSDSKVVIHTKGGGMND